MHGIGGRTMGRLIDADDLIGYLGFKDTQEVRQNDD